MRKIAGVPKKEFVSPEPSPFVQQILGLNIQKKSKSPAQRGQTRARRCCFRSEKPHRRQLLPVTTKKNLAEAKGAFAEAKDTVFRELILEGKRVDGRDTKTVRPIVVDLDVLPKSHGSVVFTRGETQGLVTTTLGTADDEQLIDGIKPKYFENFLLHYNFPGFSVGEVGGRPGPGRREIGHGALARAPSKQCCQKTTPGRTPSALFRIFLNQMVPARWLRSAVVACRCKPLVCH